ncbi:hypothetical protein RND71_013478 [Anisodus tanguticus]|uniref:Uncharacterized protein n=1 Tax=Anisodus tanguticus TaxID=243964 RepID=A0AAE1SA70_9SOLA|nr:hypothetical protein RND71_013478 [Anisodus tanguticus]
MALLASGEQEKGEVLTEVDVPITLAFIPVGWYPFQPKWVPLRPDYPLPVPSWFLPHLINPFRFGPWGRIPVTPPTRRKLGPGLGGPEYRPTNPGPELSGEPYP